MVRQITRGKLVLFAGVNWSIAQDKQDAKVILGDVPRSAMRLSIQPPGDDRIWFGHVPRQAKTGLAAAALVGAVIPDAIAAIPLGDGDVWLCATLQGMPLPTKDIVCSESEVRGHLLEWMSFFPSAVIYGEVNGAAGTVDDFWDLIDAAIRNKDIPAADMRRMRFVRPMGVREALHWGLVIFSAAGMGVAAWYFLLRQPPPPPLPPVNHEALAEIVKAQGNGEAERNEAERRKIIEAAIKAHYAQAEMQHQGLFERLSKDFQPWIDAANSLPLSVKGYVPSGVTCEADHCQVYWNAMNQARAKSSDRFSIPGFVKPSDSQLAGGMDFVAQSKLDAKRENTKKVRQHTGAALAEVDAQVLRADLVDTFRMPGLQANIGVVQDVKVAGVPDGGVDDRLIAKTVSIDLSFSGKDGMRAFPFFVEYIKGRPFSVDRYSVNGVGAAVSRELKLTMILLGEPPVKPSGVN